MELKETKGHLLRYANSTYESFENYVKKSILRFKKIIYRNYILKEPVLQEKFALKFEEFKIISDEYILSCERLFKFILDTIILEKRDNESPEGKGFKEIIDCLDDMSSILIHITYNLNGKKRKEFEELIRHMESLTRDITSFEDQLNCILSQHKEYMEIIKKYIK